MTPPRRRQSCALCGTRNADAVVLSLPATPCANEFLAQPREQDHFPLDLHLCPAPDCGHLQLGVVVDPVRLFGEYVYVSGTSPVFVDHFAAYAQRLVEVARLDADSVVIDVGSNDGILLEQLRRLGVTAVHGVEPAAKIAVAANARGIPTTNAFFDRRVAAELRGRLGAADVVTANNVFAHIEDLEHTALAVRDLLAPDGIFVFEVSYLADVVDKMLFDTIYHEHLAYHTVRPLVAFFARLGMSLFDVERVATHGGSLRGYVSRGPRSAGSRVAELARAEEAAGLFRPATYTELGARITRQGRALRTRMTALRSGGTRFCGYGAPAKLTTLAYAFGLTGRDIEFVVDDSPLKRNLRTPGTHIPVVGSDRLEAVSGQDYQAIVFAWNFFDSIVTRNGGWSGGWINPLDEVHRAVEES